MSKTSKLSPEVRERAVRMVQEHRGEYPSLWAAVESMAPKIVSVPLEAEIAKVTAANKLTYAKLEENSVDLRKLQSWLEKIRKLDFYSAALATDAWERLQACESLLDVYAKRVFEAHDENH